jgi:hypothetical protein
MPEKPEDFDALGSNTTLWSHTFEQVHNPDLDKGADPCSVDVSFVFLNGMIWIVQDCECGIVDRCDELSAERTEALQDQLYNWVAWRQS